MTKSDKFRMLHWLLLAAVFYATAMITHQPQAQTALWKLGNITAGSFLGYWIDRNLFGRIDNGSSSARLKARAIIVGASIVGMAFGL